MADPVTIMAGVGMAASVAGAATSAIGAKSAGAATAAGDLYKGTQEAIGATFTGAATNQMYQFRAGIAQLNKKIALQNRDYARASGEVEAQESGMKTRAVISQTKAAQGASELDVNTGTAVAVRQSEHAVGIEDQAIIRSNAARKAYGFETEAVEADISSKMDLAAGANAVTAAGIKAQTALTVGQMGAGAATTAADFSAASSILGGISSVSSKWFQYKNTFGGDRPIDVGSATQTSTIG